MRRNYILLPENIQRRPLRPKKDERGWPSGPAVPGDAKVMTAMVNNAKKAEERGDLRLFNFIKKLNKVLAACPTLPGSEQTKVEATPKLIATNEEDASGSLHSQLPQKWPVADSAKSRVKLEDMPRQPNIVDSAEYTVNLVGNADSACAYDTFPDHHPTHQLVNQPNFIFPEHETPNWPVEPFWLNADPTPGFPLHNGFKTRNDENFELEGVAIAGMGEPMEIDPEFPTFIPNDTYAGLNLERVAIACAYAGMDEPMDTILDDSRGPLFDFVCRGLQMFDQPGFAQYVPSQQAPFAAIRTVSIDCGILMDGLYLI
ncbi:hypothetical protein JOM56_004417 [Amanita muscaria]